MPRAGLTADAVIERAAEMLDERPTESLSLTALAESLGVQPPSLYKHVDGLAGLRRGVMLRAKVALAHALGQAAIGWARNDAISRVSYAYRGWALRHPAQYSMAMWAPRVEDEQDVQASASLADVVYKVLSGYDLQGEDAVDATRFLRSALHGFVALETAGAFQLPTDIERSFARLVATVGTSLSAWPRP